MVLLAMLLMRLRGGVLAWRSITSELVPPRHIRLIWMRRATLQYNISMTSQAYIGQDDEDRIANKAATCFMMQCVGGQVAMENANSMKKCRKKVTFLESSPVTSMRLSSDPGFLADKKEWTWSQPLGSMLPQTRGVPSDRVYMCSDRDVLR